MAFLLSTLTNRTDRGSMKRDIERMWSLGLNKTEASLQHSLEIACRVPEHLAQDKGVPK
jgi:hypothetical protein